MNAIHVTGIVESTVLQVHTEDDRLAFEGAPLNEESLNAVFRTVAEAKVLANTSPQRLSDIAAPGTGAGQ